MLVVDVSAEPPTKGRIAAYEIVPFIRLRDGSGSGWCRWTTRRPIGPRARQRFQELFHRTKGRADRRQLFPQHSGAALAGFSLYLKRSRFRAIDFVFGHLLSRRLERFDDPFPDTVNI